VRNSLYLDSLTQKILVTYVTFQPLDVQRVYNVRVYCGTVEVYVRMYVSRTSGPMYLRPATISGAAYAGLPQKVLSSESRSNVLQNPKSMILMPWLASSNRFSVTERGGEEAGRSEKRK